MGEEPVKYQPDTTIFLVACVKTKQPQPMAVKDLYTSEWFRRARAFVESTRCPWYVLSAEYGLLYPDDVVAPYDRTLKQMSAPERRSWGERVQRQLETLPLKGKMVVLLAGRAYRDPVVDYLRSRAAVVRVPMENLPQGRQLQWLGEQVRKVRSRTGPRLPDAAGTMSADRASGTSDAGPIREALLELGDRIDREAMIPTVEPGAARLVLADPYAFLLATCLDRGSRAEIIWTIPTWLQRLWGHLDPHRIRHMDDGAIAEAIANLPKQPRYRSAAVPTIRELTRIVVDEYAGDARALWKDRPATEFRFTLERVPGVGPGIASMAVQLVDRLFPGELGTGPTAGLDIKPDVHTRRVLYRLGLASESTDRAAHDAARCLMPDAGISGPPRRATLVHWLHVVSCRSAILQCLPHGTTVPTNGRRRKRSGDGIHNAFRFRGGHRDRASNRATQKVRSSDGLPGAPPESRNPYHSVIRRDRVHPWTTLAEIRM